MNERSCKEVEEREDVCVLMAYDYRKHVLNAFETSTLQDCLLDIMANILKEHQLFQKNNFNRMQCNLNNMFMYPTRLKSRRNSLTFLREFLRMFY